MLRRRNYREILLTIAAGMVLLATTEAHATCPNEPDVTCKFAGSAALTYSSNAIDAKDKLSFKLSKGATSSAADFGDPTTATTYDVCIYGDTTLLYGMAVPADGDCTDGTCWKTKSKGPAYADKLGTHDGIVAIALSSPSDGTDTTKVSVKGKGDALPDLSLPLPEPIRVQVRNSDGKCWGASFTGAVQDTTKNKLKAKTKLEVLPTCSDGAVNGFETDIDCGGNCSACTFDQFCQVNADCTTGICRSGRCNAKRVFVTNSTTDGRFNSNGLGILVNADNTCNALAAGAGSTSHWVAWLSTPTVNAVDRILDTEYRLTDGTLVFANKAQITNSPGWALDTLSRDQHGQPVSGSTWTATGGGVYVAGNDCNGWTTNSNSVFGIAGLTNSTANWSIGGAPSCGTQNRFICFEQ